MHVFIVQTYLYFTAHILIHRMLSSALNIASDHCFVYFRYNGKSKSFKFRSLFSTIDPREFSHSTSDVDKSLGARILKIRPQPAEGWPWKVFSTLCASRTLFPYRCPFYLKFYNLIKQLKNWKNNVTDQTDTNYIIYDSFKYLM